MNAWRGLAFGLPPTFDPRWSVLILLASGIIAYGMAIYLFNWDSKNRRAGRNPMLGLLAMLPYVLGALFLVH
jgi:hypothetical protein